MKNLFAVALAFTALSASFASNTAHAAAKCKPITKLPYQITVSGVYCLKKDLTFVDSSGASITTGNAIAIGAENTVLDLNGFTLSGGPAPSNTNTTGIHISRNNVTIRNGNVTNFYMGIHASGFYSGAIIENVTMTSNKYIGIYLYGNKATIRNNFIIDTGGSTYITPNMAGYGIYADGDDISIVNNVIDDVVSTGTGRASGIAGSTVADRIIAAGNVISNIDSPSNFDSGIWFDTPTTNHIAYNNRITNPGSYGIAFNGSATGSYMNNLVENSAVGDYANGTAAGSTNY